MYKLFAYATFMIAAFFAQKATGLEHSVSKGETLTEIASRYDVTVEAIRIANSLRDADELNVGQKLLIPESSSAFVDYTVRRGDNLSDIARAFGLSPQAIMAANNLSNANRISIGQVLKIPSSAKTSSTSFFDYKIRSGDNLSDIAKNFGVSLQELKSANGIVNANRISVGQVIKIPSSKAPPSIVEYKIRRGDSLSDLAKKYGTSLSEITRLNGIGNANRIKIGQVIKIPVAYGFTAPNPNLPELSKSDLRALDRIHVKSNQWKHIVIHHSASASGSAKAFDRFHREERHMENGLAYHFVIGNGRGMKDGELAVGDRWKKQLQGGHLSSYALNQISVGICLVGDFSKTRPSSAQMETLEALVRYLMDETNLPTARVTTHTLIHPKHTLCPGKYFPIESFKANLDG